MKCFQTLIIVLLYISSVCGNSQSTGIFDANEIKVSKSFNNYLFAGNFLNSNYFSFPKNSTKSTMYYATFNITARDSATSQVHAFNNFSLDESVIDGPLSINGNLDTTNHDQFKHVWSISEADINDFLQAYYQGGSVWANYQIKSDFITWPANGGPGFDNQLSDYFDMNNDGYYNPLDGDYPLIKGSQLLRWIYNDMGQYQNNGMGLEIRANLFGCSSYPSNSPINRTIFVEFDIYNRSLRTYEELQCGLLIDFDIGCGIDDFFRTQVELNGIQAYNSTLNDNCNGPNSYLSNTPVQSVSILSINNQSVGNLMFSSALFNNALSAIDAQPNNANELFNIHAGKWANGSPKYFGGLAVDSTLGYGSTRFMYQGDSDPLNYGIEIPNYPFYWTMEDIDGNGTMASSFDYKSTLSSIPLILRPNEKMSILFAFITTQDPNLSISQLVEKNKEEMIEVKNRYINNQINCLAYTTSIPQVVDNNFGVYPNPASNEIFIDGLKQNENYTLKVYDINGKVWADEIWNYGKSIDISNLKTGIYVLQVRSEMGIILTEKFVKFE